MNAHNYLVMLKGKQGEAKSDWGQVVNLEFN